MVILSESERTAYRKMIEGWPPNSRFAVNSAISAAAAVDRETGTLIAVLPDGTGGGVTEEEIDRNFKQIIALVEMSGSVGALSAWAKLEKAKLEKLRVATIAIHRMDAQGVIDLLHEEACKKLGKMITAGAFAGLRRASPAWGGVAIDLRERAKDIKRWGDAAGIPPSIPTDIKPCW